MAKTDLDTLCEEIKKKAHQIVSYSNGEKTTNYFIEHNELYDKLIDTPHKQLKQIVDKIDGTIHLIDIENNLVARFDKKGFVGGSYNTLVKERDRYKIEKILENEKKDSNKSYK